MTKRSRHKLRSGSRQRLRYTAAAVMITILASFLAACDTYDAFYREFVDKSEETYETVKIGVFEPLSGADKEFGELEKIGIELGREVFPTCMKKEVELIYADNKSDIYVAEEAIQDLIKKKPAVILGSYGSVYSLVAGKYIEEAQIPAIAITNTNPLVTSNNPYYFRVCFIDSYQGVVLAKYAFESMGAVSAAVMRPRNDDLAAAMVAAFEDKFVLDTQNPSAIVKTVEYTAGDTDFSAQLTQIKQSGVTVVFLPANETDGAAIVTQAKEMGVNAVFLGTEAWDTEGFIEKVGDAAGMAVFSTVYDAEASVNGTTELFLAAYREKYGGDAVPEPAVALGFDAYMVAVAALDKIGTVRDGDLLRLSLQYTFQHPGASGNITIGAGGDPMKTVIVKGIRNGESHNIYTMEPAVVNPVLLLQEQGEGGA